MCPGSTSWGAQLVGASALLHGEPSWWVSRPCFMEGPAGVSRPYFMGSPAGGCSGPVSWRAQLVGVVSWRPQLVGCSGLASWGVQLVCVQFLLHGGGGGGGGN